MADLLARAARVESRLTTFANLGMLMSFERRPNMTRRWIAVLCQPPGSEMKEVALDTVHDAEMFAAGLESAVYGWATIVRTIDAGTGVSLDELIEEPVPQTGTMAAAEMTRRAMDRYADALNTLKEYDS